MLENARRVSKWNSLLCFELLFHKPRKNDILAAQRSTRFSRSEIFSTVRLFGVIKLHSRDAPRSPTSVTCDSERSHGELLHYGTGGGVSRAVDGPADSHFARKREKLVGGRKEGKDSVILVESRAETCYREDSAPRCERVHTEFIPLPCRVHAHPHPHLPPRPHLVLVLVLILVLATHPNPFSSPRPSSPRPTSHFPLAGFRFRFRTGSPPKG